MPTKEDIFAMQKRLRHGRLSKADSKSPNFDQPVKVPAVYQATGGVGIRSNKNDFSMNPLEKQFTDGLDHVEESYQRRKTTLKKAVKSHLPSDNKKRWLSDAKTGDFYPFTYFKEQNIYTAESAGNPDAPNQPSTWYVSHMHYKTKWDAVETGVKGIAQTPNEFTVPFHSDIDKTNKQKDQ